MTATTPSGDQYDTVTGEIIETPPPAAAAADLPAVPDQVALGRELEAMPEDFSELAEYFAEPQPDPREVVAWIMGTAEQEQGDPEDTARSILARILSADSADQLLTGHRVVHAQEILGIALDITAVKWQRSTLEGASNVYAVVTATPLGSEQTQTITCGGRNVMMQLLNAQHRGFLPLRCVIQRSAKPTANGFHPLWLEPA